MVQNCIRLRCLVIVVTKVLKIQTCFNYTQISTYWIAFHDILIKKILMLEYSNKLRLSLLGCRVAKVIIHDLNKSFNGSAKLQ